VAGGLLGLCALSGLALVAGGAPWWGVGFVLLGYVGTGVLHVLQARRQQGDRAEHRSRLTTQTEAAAAELEAQRRRHLEQERDLAEQALALEAKNRELNRLSEAKSQFLAATSHELRTPLNAIIGFAELLLDGAAGPVSTGQAEYLSDIRTSGTHLLRLINDILDYSKLEAGKLHLTQERVDFPEVVKDAAHMLLASAQKKSVALEVVTEAAIAVMADPLRLKQVVLNLVANAVKFTPNGGRVEVRLESRDGRAVLSVSDTGIGIAPEHHAAIFEPFTQVEGQESRRFEGTGLGLSLVKRLLDPMGGTVQVQSAEGQGATFIVELPKEASRVLLAPPPTERRIDVVVAEDDDATRFMLCRVLVANGCEARSASNGHRALEALAEHLPDVLVLDLMMPELDGYGVLERLRALPRGDQVRVLVFSATEPTDDERHRLEAAGAHILVKGTVATQAVIAAVQHLASTPASRSAA
jgi:signal transduction histidine kinase/CheY-like chemotaxis protein